MAQTQDALHIEIRQSADPLAAIIGEIDDRTKRRGSNGDSR